VVDQRKVVNACPAKKVGKVSKVAPVGGNGVSREVSDACQVIEEILYRLFYAVFWVCCHHCPHIRRPAFF